MEELDETTREREARSWRVRLLARMGFTHRPHEGPLVGPVGLFERLWHLRLPAAIVLSAPALFLCFWYSYEAFRVHLAYNRAFGQDEPLTAELFQLHLHDQLRRDWRRASIPTLPSDSELPAYFLYLGNAELDKLEKKLPPSDGKGKYVEGYFRRGKRVFKADLRYRGNKHWHWNYAQKSWKVRLRGGGFLDGEDVFGLINTPEAMPFGEEILLGMARQLGLLTPEYFPLRLYVNNAYLGVYYYSAQPDEGILREANRFPGNLFSGNEAPIDPVTGVSRLWLEPDIWKKVASVEGEKEEERRELKELLDVVAHGTASEFAQFAERHLDLERFITFDALDVIFGGNEHDFHQNHKLYFDPYRGRFEPVGWSFRGWRHEPVLNRTDNPLLLRLKELPEYTTLRNRKVYELIRAPHTPCSPEEIRARAVDRLRTLSPELEYDPYWDAARLLPPVSRYYRQMVRPMDPGRQEEVFSTVMSVYEKRVDWLKKDLESEAIEARLVQVGEETLLDLSVGGNSGYRVEKLQPEWEAGCTSPRWSVRSYDGSGGWGEARLDLYPASSLVARTPVHPYRGNVRAVPAPSSHFYRIDAGKCRARAVAVTVANLVTGQVVERTATLDPSAGAVLPSCVDEPFASVAGRTSPHDWCVRPPVPVRTVLGPGEVRMRTTRVFPPDEEVVVQAGTRLVMGPGASLIFRGRVEVQGTSAEPVVIVPEQETWGGLAVLGEAAAGSSFRHLRVSGGTHADWSLTHLPGTINIQDTRDVSLSECVFADNAAGEEMVHAAYVQDLVFENTIVSRSGGDALDIELSQGRLEGVSVFGAGDDCLDLMGTRLDVRRAKLTGCVGNALSAGERSHVQAYGMLAGASRTGVLVKNNSRVELEGSLLWRCNTGVEIDSRQGRYEGKSRVSWEQPFAIDCERFSRVRDGGDRRLGSFAQPGRDDLPTLRSQVLGVSSWDELPEAFEAWSGGRP